MAWGKQSHRIVPADWAQRKAAVLRRDRGVCHVCGHGPADGAPADQCDHIINVAAWTGAGDPHAYSNLAAIHSWCSVCNVSCHKGKTAQEGAAARRKQNAKRRHPTERPPGMLP